MKTLILGALALFLAACGQVVALDSRDPGGPEGTVQTDTEPAPTLPDTVTIVGG